MRGKRFGTLRGVVVATGILLAAALPTTAAVTTIPATGPFPYTLSSPGSYELGGNAATGGGDGIIIDANGVSLNLKGFTISGATGVFAAGVRVVGTRHGAAISNGVIQNCYHGVSLDTGTRRNFVERVHFDSCGRGIDANGIDDCVIRYNRFTVAVTQVGMVVVGNDIVASYNRITGAGSTSQGMGMQGFRHRIFCNEVTKTSNAITITDTDDSLIASNTCHANQVGIRLRTLPGGECDNNRIVRNRLVGNAQYGIVIDHPITRANLVEGNYAFGNGTDLSDAPLNLATCRNTWRRNLFVTDNEAGADVGPGAGCIR